MRVEIENGTIHAIEILRHDNGFGAKGEDVVDSVLQHQILEVDVISGATYSSNTILKAIENALEEQT